MRTSLIVAAAVGFTACGALAQGRFIFGNECRTCTPPLAAPVSTPDCMWRFSGWSCYAQAYIKPAGDPDSSFRPVGEPVHFRTGTHAGYIESVEIITPFPPNTQIDVQMRAWEALGGDSYEAAIYMGMIAVESNVLTLLVTAPPDPAPYMVGLGGFCLAAPPPPRPPVSAANHRACGWRWTTLGRCRCRRRGTCRTTSGIGTASR